MGEVFLCWLNCTILVIGRWHHYEEVQKTPESRNMRTVEDGNTTPVEDIAVIGKTRTVEDTTVIGKMRTFEEIPAIGRTRTLEEIPRISKTRTVEDTTVIGKTTKTRWECPLFGKEA